MIVSKSGFGAVSKRKFCSETVSKIVWICNTPAHLVEVLDVEARTQGGLCPGPQLPDLHLANLVASGLTRPGHVAVNLENGDACFDDEDFFLKTFVI
jgi:hypothetical protein